MQDRKMQKEEVKVLLIEDNPGDARLAQELLSEGMHRDLKLQHADRLQTGLELLAGEKFDVVILDLGLPDSSGIETLTSLRRQAMDVPVIALTGYDDESLGIEAVHEGAQDYLIKGKINSDLINRSIEYAIERQRVMEELRSLSLVDELTGLSNRRGFLTLAEQQMKVAMRLSKGLVLLFIDLDNMKWINDTMGHHEGDVALIEVANILKGTFREADIIARIGGDEFVVFAVESHEGATEALVTRLREKLKSSNAEGKRKYELSVSIGIASCSSENRYSVTELLSKADTLMYEEKRKRKKS